MTFRRYKSTKACGQLAEKEDYRVKSNVQKYSL